MFCISGPNLVILAWMVHTQAWHRRLYGYKDTRKQRQYTKAQTGARPTNDMSIDFEIRPKFRVFSFEMYSTDHKEILHTSLQCNCCDVC